MVFVCWLMASIKTRDVLPVNFDIEQGFIRCGKDQLCSGRKDFNHFDLRLWIGREIVVDFKFYFHIVLIRW